MHRHRAIASRQDGRVEQGKQHDRRAAGDAGQQHARQGRDVDHLRRRQQDVSFVDSQNAHQFGDAGE